MKLNIPNSHDRMLVVRVLTNTGYEVNVNDKKPEELEIKEKKPEGD